MQDLTLAITGTASLTDYRPRGAALNLLESTDTEVLISGPAGTGKAQPLDAVVQTPAGPRMMADIKAGDYVFGADGLPVMVTGIPFRGTAPVWLLTLTGGVTVECSDGHLWQTNAGVMSVADLLDAGLHDRRGRRKFWVPRPLPVEYHERAVPIPPYTLGVLLGDGYLRPGTVEFTTEDQEIEDRVASEVSPRYKISVSPKSGNASWNARIVSANGHKPRRASTAKRGYVSRTISGKWMARARVEGKRADKAVYIGSFNTPEDAQAAIDLLPPVPDAGDSIHGDIDALGLRNAQSHDKFVPDAYKLNSACVRSAVLRGLMDTDGYAGKTDVSFCSVSRRLAEDVRWLAESLGGIATISTKQPKGGRLAYQVWLRMPEPAEVFHLPRKRERAGVRKSPVRRYIEAAEFVGERECQCITVNSPDGLYLTERFVVTHNSRACLEKLHQAAEAYPGMRGLIVRKTRASLTDTALVTFEEKVIPRLHPCQGGAGRANRRAYSYPNGSELVCGGLDKVSRIMSSEYDLIFVQEGIELTESDHEMLTTRLRNGRMPYQQLLADSNPDAPTHWLKRRCDSGRCRMLESRHEDNPMLWDGKAWTPTGVEYLAKLDALTGPRLQRLRWGRWVQAEGVVYEGWNAAIHLIDRFPIPADWARLWVIDFGFTNPFVCQWWARDGDGRLFRYREIYHTGRLVEDHARRILELSKGEPAPEAVVCDTDAEDRATFERHTGYTTTPAMKDKSPGIQAVASRLKVAGDGKPRIFFLRDSLDERDPVLVEAKKPCCTEEEFDGYVWDVRSGRMKGEEPIKLNDHGMDATRYGVVYSDNPSHGMFGFSRPGHGSLFENVPDGVFQSDERRPW